VNLHQKRTLPDATLVLEHNGEVIRARVEAAFDGEKYRICASEGRLAANGAYHGVLHWTFPEGVFIQGLEVRVHDGVATGTPAEAMRRFQRRRERRFDAALPVQFFCLQDGRRVSCEGVTRDLSRHGLSAVITKIGTTVNRGMFLEFTLSLAGGKVEGLGRVVEVQPVPSAGVLLRMRISGMTEDGISLFQEWLERKKKEESE
jgi:hypothetical protein